MARAAVRPFAAPMAHGLRMLVNLVIVKMIAVLIGPSGMGVLGNFMSVTTMVSVFAGGGIITGISKFVAEYQHTPRRMIGFIGAAVTFGLAFSALAFLVSIVFAEPLSRALFGAAGYSWLLPCLGLASLLCFIGAGTIAIVNGQHRPDLFAAITITGYVGCIPCAYFLIYFLGLKGAALALLLSISCTAVPALWLIAKSRISRLVRLGIDFGAVTGLAKFSLMALVSAALFPAIEILIRSMIIEKLGLVDAGYWQAMTRLSGAYLGFFTLFLGTTYMPRLSAMQDKKEIFCTVRSHLLVIGAAFCGAALVIYMLRDFVILVLFSSSFKEMRVLFGWQLIGDFFRTCAYVIGFLGVAKAALKIYVAAEFIQCFLYGGLAAAILSGGGDIVNVTQMYAVAYAIYFCITLIALGIYYRVAK